MKSIRAKRTEALDEDDLRQLTDLSFTSVIAEIAHSEPRAHKDPKPSRPELDLESTHTDRTINDLLAGTFSPSESSSDPAPRVPSGAATDSGAGEATEDLIAPDLIFPELQLKS